MDTQTQRRGRADTSSGRFAKLLVVSLLLHLPFTPWAGLVGLLSLWSPTTDDEPPPPITAIPVDLIEDQSQTPAASVEPAQPESTPGSSELAEPAVKKPKPKPDPTKVHDAGAPDADEPDADEPDASDAGRSTTDAGPQRVDTDAGVTADAGAAGARPLVDPTLAGGLKQVVDAAVPIRITIYTDKVRGTQVGARVGPLLRSLYQWRDFFGPTSIDPIRDIDQIWIYATQLRDLSHMTAILKHHLPPDRMHTAVDGLVRADHAGGAWLDAGVPAASVHAAGADLRFILANATTVMITPPETYELALTAAKKSRRLPPSSGPEAVMLYLATPWHAFVGLPINVPHSIKWARVRVTPTSDGGASAEIEAEDESPAEASEDADYLTRTANGLAQLNLGFLGSLLGQPSHKFIERVAFSANGKMIHGEAFITADQLSSALDMAGAFLADREVRRAHTPVAPSATPSPR